jgi:hypothetical protein
VADEKALAWIRASLIDVINGEPEINYGRGTGDRSSLIELWPGDG